MYQITITEKKVEKVLGGKEWAVVEERPYTKEEYSDLQYYDKQNTDSKVLLKSIRGYTPEIEVEKTIEREVLKQTVELLDLQKVIKAINGIE